jgi:hypothetical protein
MCIVLPPGDNPIAVNKYIISYHNHCIDIYCQMFLSTYVILRHSHDILHAHVRRDLRVGGLSFRYLG